MTATLTDWEQPLRASQIRRLSRWERAGITVGLAVSAVGFAACGTSHVSSFKADPAHCLPVVQASPGAYPQAEEIACQRWNEHQANAWAKTHTETGIYAKVDRCVYQTAWIKHQSAAKCWAMLPQVEGIALAGNLPLPAGWHDCRTDNVLHVTECRRVTQ